MYSFVPNIMALWKMIYNCVIPSLDIKVLDGCSKRHSRGSIYPCTVVYTLAIVGLRVASIWLL